MEQGSSDCVQLAVACVVLSKSRVVQALVKKAVGVKDFPTALAFMKTGKLEGNIGGLVHDLLIDTIRNESTQVWTGFIHYPHEDYYSLIISEYHGIYWVHAIEYDPVGYFLDLDSAVAFARSNWENVYEDGEEPDDGDSDVRCPFCQTTENCDHSKMIVDMQADLPRTIRLAKYSPVRNGIGLVGLKPTQIHGVDELPDYLILGSLNPNQCEFSDKGWHAKWQGLESDTFFEIFYFATKERYEIRQKWRGVDGGLSCYPSSVPLNTLIPQSLYMTFPSGWDKEAKNTLEDLYQLSYQEQVEGLYNFCGLPDGAFRTIAFPVSVQGLRGVREWLENIAENDNLIYPFSAEAKLIFQAVNYIEGKAPEWTQNESVLFGHSVTDTGLVPKALPIREVASNGSAAWTLRREIYYVFIRLPFAGLTHFLELLSSSKGPVRKQTDEFLRGELQSIVMPVAFEVQVESFSTTDKGKTTRTSLFFEKSDQTASVEKVRMSELSAEDDLNAAESISSAVVSTFEKLMSNQ